jgi:DNA-binding response OmpR family regulator
MSNPRIDTLGTVLVVDPDKAAAQARAYALLRAGWYADAATPLSSIRRYPDAHQVDVIVLGHLEHVNELAFIRELRAGAVHMFRPETTMIALTVNGDTGALAAYQAGADLTLPDTVPNELLVAALEQTQRRHVNFTLRTSHIGEITVNRAMRRVSVKGTELNLSRKEFDLIDAMAATGARVSTKAELARAVWGDPIMATNSRAMDSHISRINRKATAEGLPAVVINHWGRGWTLNADGQHNTTER